MDGRKNNKGTIGNNGGRKSKADEDRIRTLSVSALCEVFGSEEDALKHLATNAKVGGKDGFPYLKLLLEYAYGKPKETIDMTNKITMVSFED